MTPRILILAGTTEARALAARIVGEAPRLRAVASLAGATPDPAAYACETRTGGFGGAEALARWLEAERIAAVVDASHPFAARITRNAVDATRRAGRPLLRLERPAWTPQPGERWTVVPDLDAANRALPSGARAFLAVGSRSLDAFRDRPDLWIAARVIAPPGGGFPLAAGRFVVDRPPYSVAGEARLFEALGVSHVVTKNAGGAAGRTKLDAAAALGLSVVMAARPDPHSDPCSERRAPGLPAPARAVDVETALAWIRRTALGDDAACVGPA